MDIEKIIQDKLKSFEFKNLKPKKDSLDAFLQCDIQNYECKIEDTISIKGDISKEQKTLLDDTLFNLQPWRKGPFDIFDIFIDTEWKSYIKYKIIQPYLDIENKTIIDIGCNNGYYLFQMLSKNPRNIIGFDPGVNYYMQFLLFNHFIKSKIKFELLGVEHIYEYVKCRKIKVDYILYLGVLYHRRDPISSLKEIAKSLKKGGKLILDSFIIDGEEHIALSPQNTYSKIPNIYFIPTINTLKNWLLRSGFTDIELIDINTTTTDEQRMTKWINTQSLEHFIDEETNLTVEGYPRPKRGYIICTKQKD